MKKIYLAGPMDFVSNTEQTSWRNIAKEKLSSNFIILDPCRRPHTSDLNAKEIFNLDMEDVNNADLLLVDCRHHGVPTFGTPCEVFYASYVLKKPVIGWHDTEKPMSGKGIFQQILIDRVFASLQQSLEHLTRYYV